MPARIARRKTKACLDIENCLIITPFHWLANRARETARGESRHGSCGRGVGEARGDALAGKPSLYVRDLINGGMREKLTAIKDLKAAEFGYLDMPSVREIVRQYNDFTGRVSISSQNELRNQLSRKVSVFEGAQGILLDETHGFAPYNTWTDTTFNNAEEILDGLPSTRIGVCRTMATRHGAGPLPTESSTAWYAGDHNADDDWQGSFRFGHMDPVLLKYAAEVSGRVDEVFLTHCDKAGAASPCARWYEVRSGMDGADLAKVQPSYGFTEDVAATVEEAVGARIRYKSNGPTWADKVVL